MSCILAVLFVSRVLNLCGIILFLIMSAAIPAVSITSLEKSANPKLFFSAHYYKLTNTEIMSLRILCII